ncbi:hypothetical protein ACJMK2_008771, partial [Sinanodonta woodiana]
AWDISLTKNKEMPIDHESLRLSCVINDSGYLARNYTLTLEYRNTEFIYTLNKSCSRVCISYEFFANKFIAHLNIKNLNRIYDGGPWECSYGNGVTTLTAELNLTVY